MTHQKTIQELDHEIKNLLLENEQINLSSSQNRSARLTTANLPSRPVM